MPEKQTIERAQRPNAKESRRARYPANSFARRYLTSEKGGTQWHRNAWVGTDRQMNEKFRSMDESSTIEIFYVCEISRRAGGTG